MFTIKIRQTLKPFSHQIPTRCLIPKTTVAVAFAPGILKFQDFISDQEFSLSMEVKGPISNFTVEQEIDRGKVIVFMETATGYFRYVMFRDRENLILKFEKMPRKGILIDFQNVKDVYFKKDELILFKMPYTPPMGKRAQLFLGCNKAQDAELIARRSDLKEILPLLFALAQETPIIDEEIKMEGAFELFGHLKQHLEERDLKKAETDLLALYGAGFEDMFIPRANDTDFQGVTKTTSTQNPALILNQLKSLILSLFVKIEGEEIYILPHLLPSFVSGRLKGVTTSFGKIDLEWSKKQLKRVAIYATDNQKLIIKFPKKLKSYRLTVDRWWTDTERLTHSPLRVIAKHNYYLDRFKN
ncbi:MAG: hypothetical protein K9M07_05625 [Simkaniaceae bacterium]|nr:hypothetical protein [Simkaniaceae bacterium]MCF7852699.1 hypothetical protein [Simkaniaceae bacterium]